MNPALKQDYRRIRNGLGMVLAIAWITYRWHALDALKRAALAAVTNCDGLFRSVACGWDKNGIEANFGGGVVLAFLAAPLALVVTHYVARWWVDQAAAAERNEAERTAAAQELAGRQASEARMALAHSEAARAKGQIDRSEFIHKLGSVGDFLDLLGGETDPGRRATIRLGVAQALRDLVAKHSIDGLRDIVSADEAVEMSLRKTLERLDAAGFDHAPEMLVLRVAQAELPTEASPMGVALAAT